MIPKSAIVLVLAGFCGFANAQHSATGTGGSSTVLDVEITNLPRSECAAISEVLVVRGRREPPVKKTDPTSDPCRWRLKNEPTYHTNVNEFSLRVPGVGRSQCMRAQWNDDTDTGVLQFRCCPEGGARQLVLSIWDPVPLAYARTIRASD